MEYNLARYEKNLDHDGTVVSIFIAVSVQDGENGSYYEHWLSQEEMGLVLADEVNLKPILTACYAEAELKLENEIATKPMPPIHPLKIEGKKKQLEDMVDKTKIPAEKAKIKNRRENGVGKKEGARIK